MAQHSEPSLITEAELSLHDQHKARVRKYAFMMSFRVPVFILATLVYAATNNGILATIILAASIPLPWIAVLIANDRPPKTSRKVETFSNTSSPTMLASPTPPSLPQ